MSDSDNTSKLLTRGGQVTLNNLRMLLQVNLQLTKWTLSFAVFLGVVFFCFSVTSYSVHATFFLTYAKLLTAIGYGHHPLHFMGVNIPVPAGEVHLIPVIQKEASLFGETVIDSVLFALTIWLVSITVTSAYMIRRGKRQVTKKHIRGARLATPEETAKAIKKIGASDMSIANVPMVSGFEVKHTLIHGTTGSGKSQTFNQFIEQIRRRGDCAIIYDKGCSFTSKFYLPDHDVILNPFDTRCASWDLWTEATTEPDFENIAESIIPKHGETDPYWVDAARTVFAATAYKMKEDPERSMGKLLAWLLTKDLEGLGEYLEGTEAATLVSGKIEKTATSIRSVLSTYTKCLRFLVGLEGKTPFSTQEWINQSQQSQKSQFLFISSVAKHHTAIRPIISMWLSMASIAMLSLTEDYDRRIWFVCDELPTLHRLPQLPGTIAEVRKFGGCFVLGMQSFRQLEKIYGRATAAEIFDLLNTRLFYRAPSADLSEFVSKELGTEEVEQVTETYSYGAAAVRDGISINSQRVKQAIVPAADIETLPDFEAYLKVPAQVPTTKIKVPFVKRPNIAAPVELREIPEVSVTTDVEEIKPSNTEGTTINSNNAEGDEKPTAKKKTRKPRTSSEDKATTNKTSGKKNKSIDIDSLDEDTNLMMYYVDSKFSQKHPSKKNIQTPQAKETLCEHELEPMSMDKD